jgi:DNA-binding transcriptional LysR family regulator
VDLMLHLRYFLVVAEELHFGRAARRLLVAQPSLSQRIRRLEREYGAALFDRSGGRVRLTPAGEVLRAQARQIVAHVERSRVLVRRAVDGATGVLRAGVPPQTPGRVLAALPAAFAAAAPGVELDLRGLTTAEQLAALGTGDLDVGLVQHPVEGPDAVSGELRFGPVVAVPQGVVLPRVSPLADRTELAMADLAGHDLVMFPREAAPGLYGETLRCCRDHGFDPPAVRHARDPEFLLGLVAAGRAVAFDQGAIARKEPRVVWRPLAGRPLRWRTSAAWPARHAHPAASLFSEVAAGILGEDVADAPLSGTSAPDSGGPRPWAVVFGPRTGPAAGR